MRSWPVYSGLNKHKIDKIINSQITTHTLNWHQCSVLEQQECKQYCKQYNIIYKSNTHKTWVENSQITTHTVCARCAEQRGPDLGGKTEKNWNGLPTLVCSKTRTGVLKTNWIGSPDWESGSGFSRAGRSDIDMHFFANNGGRSDPNIGSGHPYYTYLIFAMKW